MAGSTTSQTACCATSACALPQVRISNSQTEIKPMATSAEWHEDYTKMSEEALNFSRAVKSVQEELEAVDWYNQRAQATTDQQLRRILEHNRDEEIEHAIMGLEYLRRMNKAFDEHMRTYLFTEGDIKIGRASCRERVKICEVGALLQKEKELKNG